MLIREATESDAMGIAEVISSISEIRSVAGVPVAEISKWISHGLSFAADHGNSTILVGVNEDGSIAGYCNVHWVPFLFLPGGEGYVTELFVRPDGRSSGLGTSFLREVEKLGRQRGCSRLSLLNGRDIESYKRSFYAKHNWVEREQMANFILPLK